MGSRLTPPRRRALDILRQHGPLSPSGFATRMWPDTAEQRGRSGITAKAGGFLGRLYTARWVTCTDEGWGITDSGRAVLAQLEWKPEYRRDGFIQYETLNTEGGAQWKIYPAAINDGWWRVYRVVDHERYWDKGRSLAEAKMLAQRVMDMEAREEARRVAEGRTL